MQKSVIHYYIFLQQGKIKTMIITMSIIQNKHFNILSGCKAV